MKIFMNVVLFIVYGAISYGVFILLAHLIIALGEFQKRITKALEDIEKMKKNSHRALNDIEKLKQSVKKVSPDTFDNYWKSIE